MQLREWERRRQKDIEGVNGISGKSMAACNQTEKGCCVEVWLQVSWKSCFAAGLAAACSSGSGREGGRRAEKKISCLKTFLLMVGSTMQLREWERGRQKDIEDMNGIAKQWLHAIKGERKGAAKEWGHECHRSLILPQLIWRLGAAEGVGKGLAEGHRA